MSSEDMARRFIETLLIDIHWNGVRSENKHDVAWLESRVKSLLPKALLVIDAAVDSMVGGEDDQMAE